MQQRDILFGIWERLYPGISASDLEQFLADLETSQVNLQMGESQADWYKDAVVYSLYADLFNNDFEGLTRSEERRVGKECRL